MSTIPVDLPSNDPPVQAPASSRRTRDGDGRCGNCGFADTGTYCSRCGEPLHGTRETVLQILWGELVENPVHNGLALVKTTWLMIARPHRFFDGVLRRQHGMTHVPFFLARVWRRVSHKPHGVPNAVKYFVLIYTLSVLAAWVVGVNVIPEIPIPFRDREAELPGEFAEPLFLLFVVFAAWMYSKAVSLLLGGRIETELLTRFMLYLNGLALIPFTGMAMAGGKNQFAFLACVGFWLYVLFVLPQLALPRIFDISRVRLGFAQAGAAVANVVGMMAILFCAGVAADLKEPGWSNPAESGIRAVRDARNALPVDTLITNLPQFTLPQGTRPQRAAGSTTPDRRAPAPAAPRQR